MADSPPRHVLITGGGRGLGYALARHCLRRGDLVSTCGRSPLAALHQERHRHYVADMTDSGQIEALFDAIRADAGYLDALVNNAGTASMNLVALTPVDAVHRVLRTNSEGPILATRAALRLLRRSAAGRIVNVSTVAVPLRLTGEAVYAASKSALETFTRIAARELGTLGVTCNAVGPSPIRTDLISGVPKAKLDKLVAEQAIPRWATPDDFINVVEFFLAPASGMVTGQVVYLGGAG
jgi:3-oxoacyl-[acyl-carrier protein] reductase